MLILYKRYIYIIQACYKFIYKVKIIILLIFYFSKKLKLMAAAAASIDSSEYSESPDILNGSLNMSD